MLMLVTFGDTRQRALRHVLGFDLSLEISGFPLQRNITNGQRQQTTIFTSKGGASATVH
jgi:hypothetical protein